VAALCGLPSSAKVAITDGLGWARNSSISGGSGGFGIPRGYPLSQRTRHGLIAATASTAGAPDLEAGSSSASRWSIGTQVAASCELLVQSRTVTNPVALPERTAIQ
jgi:hypothetical protein